MFDLNEYRIENKTPFPAVTDMIERLGNKLRKTSVEETLKLS